MNHQIRACIMAAFAFGLAFAAGVVADVVGVDGKRDGNGWGLRPVVDAQTGRARGRGTRTGSGRAARRGTPAELAENRRRRAACSRRDQRLYYWDGTSCVYRWTTGGADRSRGSCVGYDPPGRGSTPCDAGNGRGFMPLGGFGDDGDDGPSSTFSFWEWLLWNQDRSSSGE